MRVLLDASSFIHFLAAGEENILIQQAEAWDAALATCAQVSKEIETVTRKRKYAESGAYRRWMNLRGAGRVQELSDDLAEAPGLAKAVSELHNEARLFSCRELKLSERLRNRADLGEFIAVSHCLALARQGIEVILVIDDGYGRKLANAAKSILNRGGLNHRLIRVTSTRAIVERSEVSWRRDCGSVDAVIARMEKYDTIPRWK